ncbi:hypothetical protein HS088_TW19G00169 [Tripterygium wilfordii]|uniref:Bifunctional inhibitor/plant lipid transfer protein/seed storage helical domain-containing protein n=1 Tax=Tripterygium wilfordii TaxID=458696 RepID=A0A7J7C9P0_TRIWF|nr:2S sulfur-rich seed storage protein 2-like [Tripterygium wilfordii]KAF5730577.1 hypothetical protein HS088_TW19G00169 [Tripterygium wilfordii]
MAAHTTFVVVFAILFTFSTAASAFRATVTIEENSQEKSRGRGQCQEKIQMQDLSHCEEFMKQRMSRSLIVLPGSNQEDHRSMCCNQLRELGDECMCDGLEKVVHEAMQGVEQEEEEKQKMMKKAMNLQTYCRFPRRCDIQSPSIWF